MLCKKYCIFCFESLMIFLFKEDNKPMKQYPAKSILNIALAGHSGSGKTSLAEAMLYLGGGSERLGKVSDGNTVCDFDPEEIKRKASVQAGVAPVEWKGKKINLIDAPGLFDFEGGLYEAVRAADTVLITVSGKDGVCVGTEKAVKAADKRSLTKVFFVNGLCDESARFYRVFENLKASFGPSVCPVVVPYIVNGQADCYVNLLEYKAYKYVDGKITVVPIPDMGDRLEGLRTAINEAVVSVLDYMEHLESKEYFALIYRLAATLGAKEGVVLLNEKDLKRVPKDFIQQIAKSGIKAALSPTPDNSIKSGFILKNGDIEENMSFAAVIADRREAVEDVINRELFKG